MFGLKCFNESGDTIFNTDTVATRLLWEKKVSAGSSSNEVVPALSGRSIGIVTFSQESDSGGPYQYAGGVHIVTVSGTTVTWTSNGDATYCPSVDTQILIFAYD